jgi:lipopolysaccharide export system protein LptC
VANAGQLDTAAQRLDLAGNVVVTTDSGWRMTAPRMTGSLATTQLDATGEVVTTGPLGRIRSDAMQIRRDPAHPDQYLLDFTGGVRLIYEPQAR